MYILIPNISIYINQKSSHWTKTYLASVAVEKSLSLGLTAVLRHSGETSLGNRRCTDGFSAAFRGGPWTVGGRDRFVNRETRGCQLNRGQDVCLYRQGSLNGTCLFFL